LEALTLWHSSFQQRLYWY